MIAELGHYALVLALGPLGAIIGLILLVSACAFMAWLSLRQIGGQTGDVLGALTKDHGFEGAQIGKINVNEFSTYVAVAREIAPAALQKLNAGKVKGKVVKVRML